MKEFAEEFRLEPGQCTDAFSPPPAPAPVKKGSPAESWLERNTLQEKLVAALQAVPMVVQSLTRCASQTWNMKPSVILLTALHQLAAASGRHHRMRLGHLGLSCPFSVLVCAAQRSRLRFIELLGEPWLLAVRLQLRHHQAFGTKSLAQELERFQAQAAAPEARFGVGAAANINDQIRHAGTALQPNIVVPSPMPARVMQALRMSYDRTVMVVNGGIDPLDELLSAGRNQTAELCRLLEMSWQDMDLPDRGPIPRRGVIHLCWRSHMAAARRMVWGRQSPWRGAPPPVLMILQGATPAYLAPLDETTHTGWSDMLQGVYNQCRKLHEPVLWELSDDARTLWGGFHRELLGDPTLFAPVPPGFVDWIPDLVIRLALLFSALERMEKQAAPAKTIVEKDTLIRACTVGWWLAHEHLECLNTLRLPKSVDEPDEMDGVAGIDSIDSQRIGEAILEKLAAQGPLSPRELTRAFHQLPAETRDRVLWGLKRQGLVIAKADGRLAANQEAVPNGAGC